MTKFSSRRDVQREKSAVRQNSVSYKRTRCQQKLKKQRKTYQQEQREGIFYQSGDFNILTDVIDENYTTESPFVVADIETTSFYETADIIQIAAVHKTSEFVRYMFPVQHIDNKASEVNGFPVIDGTLYKNHSIITTTPPSQVAEEFLQFLELCVPRAFIVGHNVIKFDAPRIIRWLIRLNLFIRFQELVYGFINSIPLVSQGKMKKLEELARNYLITEEWKTIIENAHDALVDCQVLQALLERFKVDRSKLINNAIKLRDVIENLSIAKNERIIVQSLQPLGDEGVSKYILNKIAFTGMIYDKLKQIYKDSGDKSLRLCLSKSTLTAQGKIKPIVTASKKIISIITTIITNDINQETDEASTNDLKNSERQSNSDSDSNCDSDSNSDSKQCKCVNYEWDSNTEDEADE